MRLCGEYQRFSPLNLNRWSKYQGPVLDGVVSVPYFWATSFSKALSFEIRYPARGAAARGGVPLLLIYYTATINERGNTVPVKTETSRFGNTLTLGSLRFSALSVKDLCMSPRILRV